MEVACTTLLQMVELTSIMLLLSVKAMTSATLGDFMNEASKLEPSMQLHEVGKLKKAAALRLPQGSPFLWLFYNSLLPYLPTLSHGKCTRHRAIEGALRRSFFLCRTPDPRESLQIASLYFIHILPYTRTFYIQCAVAQDQYQSPLRPPPPCLSRLLGTYRGRCAWKTHIDVLCFESGTLGTVSVFGTR